VIALYYPNNLEGYRKDRIASVTPIPEDKGMLYGGSGYWPFYTLQAVTTDAASTDDGGSSAGVIGGVAGGVGVLAIAGFFLMRRRSGAADERGSVQHRDGDRRDLLPVPAAAG
jgi:peptide/nickel transport system substrate-binding protein